MCGLDRVDVLDKNDFWICGIQTRVGEVMPHLDLVGSRQEVVELSLGER